MGTLHRSQVYIGEDQIRLLKLEARKENLSVSELIREAIQSFLTKKSKAINWDNDPLTKAVGKFKSDVKDASTHHDFYLYGKKKD
ncbi:MAG: CopG family transcriptional regulator [Candidatus Omnitrophica bacterium]|nr:CopG family transcriptional regulator [Candidatus Omnitrophota bacterium]